MLIEQVEQAQKLQTEAEKEADAAMTQLEEFINEQEKLVNASDFYYFKVNVIRCTKKLLYFTLFNLSSTLEVKSSRENLQYLLLFFTETKTWHFE